MFDALSHQRVDNTVGDTSTTPVDIDPDPTTVAPPSSPQCPHPSVIGDQG